MKLESFYEKKQHIRYFTTVRSEIVPFLPPVSDRVLDLGCGEGSTLAFLKDRGLARWTCGVDISAPALERAKASGVDLVVQGGLDELSFPIERDSLDVVLCLDILEHLADPWATVRSVARLLKPGGILIASIPNVQTLRVLAPLLVGRWEYKDCGIMDRGHLRFFTRRSAIALLEQAGLVISGGRPLTEPHWLPRSLNTLTLHLFQRWVTVQYLLQARKPG